MRTLLGIHPKHKLKHQNKTASQLIAVEALEFLADLLNQQLLQDPAASSRGRRARPGFGVTPFAAPVPMRAGGLVRPLSIAGGLPGACRGLALGLCSHHPQLIKQTHLLAAYVRLIGRKATVKALWRGATETTTRPTYI